MIRETWCKNFCKFFVNKYSLCFVIMYNCCMINFIAKKSIYDVNSEIEISLKEKFLNILIWTSPSRVPSIGIPEDFGNDVFITRRCLENNCKITTKKDFLDNVTSFDAILFAARYIPYYHFPRRRSPHQRYVFITAESSINYPLRRRRYNNFFNLTCTYKLDSDVYFGYMTIRNQLGEVVGPKAVMHWMEPSQMAPVGDELKKKLSRKFKAAAWFVSNCRDKSNRSRIGREIGRHLAKHNMSLDIYSKNGIHYCPVENMNFCLQMLERDYYFYLSFENSYAEDYVTEKVLHALQHHTVPIVLGGANYSRFLPPGSYLNALNTTAEHVVEQMVKLIKNKEMYYEYFRWTNHYSYHDTEPSLTKTDIFCSLCRMINKANLTNETRRYKSFTKWWNK